MEIKGKPIEIKRDEMFTVELRLPPPRCAWCGAPLEATGGLLSLGRPFVRLEDRARHILELGGLSAVHDLLCRPCWLREGELLAEAP